MGIFTRLDNVLFDDKNFGQIETVDGYVEYLEGDGASYIDTLWAGYRAKESDVAGEIPSNVPKIEIKYNTYDFRAILVGLLSYLDICVVQIDNSVQYIGKGASFRNIVAQKGEEHVLEIGSVCSYLDGTLIADNSDMSNQYRLNAYPDRSMLLFGGYYATSSSMSFEITKDTKIYYFKAYEGDELVLDLRPYILNGVGCMRDELTGTIYENKGTGAFITGKLIS